MTESKPSALPLHMLCREANVLPHECIVVGDTTSDTGMARNAKAALCLGVLTGSGSATQLAQTGAHVVLSSVGDIPSLLQAAAAAALSPNVLIDDDELDVDNIDETIVPVAPFRVPSIQT